MDRPLLVIAETNEGFLSPLEMRIAQILCETVDIEVISDREYMKTYFSSPRSIDILIISEGLYTNDLTRHNIKKTFVLTEEPKTSGDCSERGGGNGEQRLADHASELVGGDRHPFGIADRRQVGKFHRVTSEQMEPRRAAFQLYLKGIVA